MKKLVIIVALSLSAIAIADRTDVWLASTVAVTKVELFAMPDGGCIIAAYGSYSNAAGASVRVGSQATELSGTNQTACLNVLTRAAVLFKADQSL